MSVTTTTTMMTTGAGVAAPAAATTTTIRISDCRKFSPNIFNKSKCSHCFRQREEHSAAALECNRASRKVSKCGYLFVAPDWDFSNPLYRTKRWQRRWFVLYDDGELTYSVDEHPETVPQACIDMTKVLEVATAEDVTGHSNSIAITAPDRVTFVKGTCSEESKWWLNILAAFPKSKGRHKRNATFPGGQATTMLQKSSVSDTDSMTPTITRNRHNSYTKEALMSAQSTGVLSLSAGVGGKLYERQNSAPIKSHTNLLAGQNNDDDEEDDGVETGEEDADEDDVNEADIELTQVNGISGKNTANGNSNNNNDVVGGSDGCDENNRNAGNEISNKVPSCLLIKDLRRDKKTIKDLTNTITNLAQHEKNHRWSTTTTAVNNVLNSHHHHNHQHRYQLQQAANQEKNSRDETDFHHCGYSNNKGTTSLQNNINQQTNQITKQQSQQQQQQQNNQTRPKSLPLAANTAPAIVSAIVKKIPPVLVTTSANLQTDTNNNDNNKNTNNIHNIKNNNNNNNGNSKSSPRLQLQLKYLQQQHQQQRGDPDGGCNLDELSNNYLAKTSELRVNLQSATTMTPTITSSVTPTAGTPTKESTVNVKKGWLLKQDSRSGDWSKHWFSLNGAALFYYRDAVCEERAVLDGVLDVNSLTQVSIDDSATKGYGFNLITWDKRRLTLASLSPNSRTSWMAALRNAAGLQISSNIVNNNTKVNNKPPLPQEPLSKLAKSTSEAIESDFMQAQQSMAVVTSTVSPLTPPTPPKSVNSHMSSDEEYRTASEGGRRDSQDWGSPLSPSPPTLGLLRIKERVRARSTQCPRLHKRSRSSPPSSRRSTLDSVGSDELPSPPIISTVQEELNIDKELQFRLRAAEKESDLLRNEAKQQEQRIAELLETLERTEQQLNARLQEMEHLRDSLKSQLESAQSQAECVVTRLTEELETSQQKIKDLEDRLMRGIDENETLYKRLRELESCSPSNFTNLKSSKLKRMDSLSDLTTISAIDPYGIERDALAEEYNELRTRFEKAVNEIRAMKRELKQSQNQYDTLEISYAALKQDLERKDVEDRAQLQMMAARIQDLTLKYSSSERQVRALKQKLAKSERRRSLSLKGTPKEQLCLSKEFEGKVCDLERKMEQLERQSKSRPKKSNSRRCSLETSASGDSLQLLLRVNDLEQRIEGASNMPVTNQAVNLSPHLIARLRSLETVLLASKERLETSLQQMQNYRAARARRSLSPSNTERKDCYRQLERSLNEVLRLLQESCETCLIGGTTENGQMREVILLNEHNPVKLALTQLETQLRSKLADLLKQRRLLRDRNALTAEKQLELVAQRIAYESIVFGQLRDALIRAENKEDASKIQLSAEVAETTHLMRLLKAKLSGKCTLKPNGSTDILAGVLARRLLLSRYKKMSTPADKVKQVSAIDVSALESLLQQQNELNIIIKRYKMNALEHLATGLAAETLSYMPGNDMVQGAVQEAWRHAQEAVNAELVQAEIAQVMLRQAERLENTNKSALGFTLAVEECMSFEQFSDAVHAALRREMELAANQLSHAYEAALTHLKRSQWHLMHMEQEPKASEARLLLAEFADIIAHKALVDARINVLRGENCTTHTATPTTNTNEANLILSALSKYENLFEDLSSEMQINDNASILAEADFDYIFKQQAIEFFSKGDNKQLLAEIANYLNQLEESLIALQCETTISESITRTQAVVESWQDVCHKCCLLHQRADALIEKVQRKLQAPCQHCEQLGAQLETRQQQHESEFMESKQHHAQELNTLLQQVDQQRQALEQLEFEKQTLCSDLSKSQERIKQQESDLRLLQEKQTEQTEQLQHLKINEQKFGQQEEALAILQLERDNLKLDLAKEKERRQLFEKRLEMLEVEHTKQLECLQEAYRDQLIAHCSDFSTNVGDEESFRQRYQMEIEQLRTLCEKGLSAMESSHRRIISDLKETHRQEIERLLLEKETALAEETQATLAALDAMRKAHQSEVQREVARFKQEFFKQIQRGEQYSLDSTNAKEEELEELRKEILSFSEKYSIKCVENAALEEKLQMVSQKLKHLQQMQQLELRNKQFRAHLASEDPTTDANFVQGLTTSNIEETSCADSELKQIGHTKSAEELPTDAFVFIESANRLSMGNTCTNMHEIDTFDDDDLDSHLKKRWSYEPCYNLRIYPFYYNIEGLKSSTFGKNLRTKNSCSEKTSSPASLSASIQNHNNNNNNNNNDNRSNLKNDEKTVTCYTNPTIKSCNQRNEKLLNEQKNEILITSTESIKKPVEVPKNINPNNIYTNGIIHINEENNNNSNKRNNNNNHNTCNKDNHETEEKMLQGQNLNNSHQPNARPPSATTAASINEISAMNENSYTTSTRTTATKSKRAPIELSIVEDADWDDAACSGCAQ